MPLSQPTADHTFATMHPSPRFMRAKVLRSVVYVFGAASLYPARHISMYPKALCSRPRHASVHKEKKSSVSLPQLCWACGVLQYQTGHVAWLKTILFNNGTRKNWNLPETIPQPLCRRTSIAHVLALPTNLITTPRNSRNGRMVRYS